MMNLYISDLHFGHKNVIRFDNRPFADVDEMDHVLIELWNGRVQPDDNVYIVGDLCYRSERPAEWYLQQLKGRKFLIPGNHDGPILDNPEALQFFEGVDKMMSITDEGNKISLCHYPIVEWNAYFKGSYHIYGHIHNRRDEAFEIMKKKDHALNAGCMINNYTPVSLKELVRNNEIFRNSADVSKERRV
ncbi:Calcineurin-like phosphoesterase superfamily protein [Lachnospiraceae bacterium XBB2008]|nr:Calcineurin-like phosphoesterase superfamily protein [Lachnospiraceae bacterium XBB2008]